MKLFPFFLLLFLFVSCQTTPDSATKSKSESEVETVTTNEKSKPYPPALQAIFDAHGGLAQWQQQGTISYEIVEETGNEKQIVDLKDRRERIEGQNFTMGYDGTNYWLDADTAAYKGNPVFYKNLMFYFYAMPFVLADAGIQYTEAAPLVFEDKSYPGFRIAYNAGVGESPEDEYFLHYDAETKQMAWLGYTVTYFTKEKSTAIKWIRYDDWMDVNDLKLPKSLAWYALEDNQPTTERSRVTFTKVKLESARPANEMFTMTPEAFVVE